MKWISIKDRLPKFNETVICKVIDNKTHSVNELELKYNEDKNWLHNDKIITHSIISWKYKNEDGALLEIKLKDLINKDCNECILLKYDIMCGQFCEDLNEELK